MRMQLWNMNKGLGRKRWIVFVAVLAGLVPLAILLETFSADESIGKSIFSRIAHAASCSCTYATCEIALFTHPQDNSMPQLPDSCPQIVYKFQVARRIIVTFRSDNTVTINIYCLSQVLLIISLTVALIAFLQLSLVVIYFLRFHLRKPLPDESTQVEDAEENSLISTSSRFLHNCTPYSFRHLEKAANYFTDEIGKGSCGVVYSGNLAHDGRPARSVAIKKMKLAHSVVDKSFEDEIRRIGMLRHKNVLQLLAYSDINTSDDLPLLMVTPLHSSLEKHLNPPPEESDYLPWLNWEARFKIAVGVAEGLAYLHDGAPQKLVHHDIKPGNILFDMDTLQAYIADFGSAKFMEATHDEVETSNFAGTSGYMDPHFRDHRRRSTKVDVYSFGAVLFVLVGGVRYMDSIVALVNYARDNDILDPDFLHRHDTSVNREEVTRTLAIARLCTKYEPTDRPTMSQVLMMLRNDIPVWRFAQDLSRAASSVATFAQTAFSKMKSFNTRAPANAKSR